MDTLGPSDEQLMRRIADGDTAAVGMLYDRYSRLVYSQARRICAEDGLAEDTAQEVFLALWRDPGRFDPHRGRFSSWLLTVVHHKAVDAVRREHTARRRAISIDDEYLERTLPVGPGADETALDLVTGGYVRDALRHLPLEQRRAVALAFYGGYTQREVAAITSVPLGTVKSRTFNGMQRLRRLLTPLVPEPLVPEPTGIAPTGIAGSDSPSVLSGSGVAGAGEVHAQVPEAGGRFGVDRVRQHPGRR
jgi:RNA polymerase sigma-70 factor (ECF subfamily)